MIWLLFKRKVKQGKHPWKNQELRNPWKSWWFDYFSKGKLNRGNTRGKAGIEKSMKNWWFDYFTKGKLNRENTRGKARNWEIHEKLMIWLLFKRKVKQGKHPWKNQELRNPWKSWWFDYFTKGKLNREHTFEKTRNWEIHEKLMIWLLFKRKVKQGKHPWKSQELRNPWKVDDLTTFQKES